MSRAVSGTAVCPPRRVGSRAPDAAAATVAVPSSDTTPRRGEPGRRPAAPRAVLLLVVGLHLVIETALTPFLPQLLSRLFGVEDLAATGTFLWVCRVSGCVAFPLWGLAARRWPAERLVLTGLSASTVLYAALVAAPDYATFTALSAAVVATNAALLLAYPALLATYDHLDAAGRDRRTPGPCRAADGTGGAAPRRWLPGIRAYVGVFHAAVVVATGVGVGVMALPDPRWGLTVFVLLAATLVVLCRRTLPQGRRTRPARHEAGARTGIRPPHLAAAAVLAVAFELGANVVRPFFTEYAVGAGWSTTVAGGQFLLASVAALAVLPFAGAAHRALGRRLLPLSLTLAAAGLLCQAMAPDPLPLTAGRLAFGAGLGLGHVALDLRVFGATGTSAPAYAVVQSARVGALFLAPLLATLAAARDLAWPLLLGGAVYVTAALLALRLDPNTHSEEAPDHGSHR